jgi:hypothetical protein
MSPPAPRALLHYAGSTATEETTMRTPLTLAACLALPLPAADWPHFLGPTRNAVSAETGLARSWPEKGPPGGCRHMAALRRVLPAFAAPAPPRKPDRKADRDELIGPGRR